MHQDQGDASHVRAYAYAYGRLYIYGPLALEIKTINQDNQQVKEASKVTITGRPEGSSCRSYRGPEKKHVVHNF